MDFGLAGVVACILRAPAWVAWYAARLDGVAFVTRRIPVRGPLPDIADHVVEPVAIGRKGADRRGTLIPVERVVLAREFALPGVRHLRAARREFVTPGVLGAA